MVSAVVCVVAVLSTSVARADDENLRTETQQAMADFKKTDSTLQQFIDNSAGYAVFPSVGKGGFIVGGAHGKGLVYQRDKVIGDKVIGKATVTQASIGAQVGGQTFDEIIVFETPEALNDFKSEKYEMNAELSAVAAKEGASAAAQYKKGVAVFTLPKKGLMAQASVGGQKFKFEPIAE